MQWERDLYSHFKMTKRIRTAFIILGLLITGMGTAQTLLDFEMRYLETFGSFPVETDPLALFYLTLSYLFWGIFFLLAGFTVERLLNFQSARAFIWGLMLLPLIYGVLRFALAVLLNLNPYVIYPDLIQYLLVMVVLIVTYLLTRYVFKENEDTSCK